MILLIILVALWVVKTLSHSNNCKCFKMPVTLRHTGKVSRFLLVVDVLNINLSHIPNEVVVLLSNKWNEIWKCISIFATQFCIGSTNPKITKMHAIIFFKVNWQLYELLWWQAVTFFCSIFARLNDVHLSM